MKSSVKFNVPFLKGGLYGFEGNDSPVDLVASLVLAQQRVGIPIKKVIVAQEDGSRIHYEVAEVIDRKEETCNTSA